MTVKSPQQQAELAVHRIRRRLMAGRTALLNQIRGLLGEFGMVLPQGANHVRSKLPALLDEGCSETLAALAVELFRNLYEELVQFDSRKESVRSPPRRSQRRSRPTFFETALAFGGSPYTPLDGIRFRLNSITPSDK